MSHPSKYGALRFCPKCGVDGLDRDNYHAESGHHMAGAKHPKVGVEYVCRVCGFAFWISKSRRVLSAEINAAESRKRAPVKFTEKCVGTDIARLYLKDSDPPKLATMKQRIWAAVRSALAPEKD